MQFIRISLEPETFQTLTVVARRERRSLPDQATVLLEQSLGTRPRSDAELAAVDFRIVGALDIILRYGQTDGDHHKAWVIDQVARELLGGSYAAWVHNACTDGTGAIIYTWETGIAP